MNAPKRAISSKRQHVKAQFLIFLITYTDGIDVRLMASERLSAHALSNIPEFSRGITSTRDE